MFSTTICAFLFIAILLCIMCVATNIEMFTYSTMYDHPTKCFSCERDVVTRLGPEWAWLGQDTKSFDAEKEMIFMTGDVASAMDTHAIRYY